jgi:hypothetical protein
MTENFPKNSTRNAAEGPTAVLRTGENVPVSNRQLKATHYDRHARFSLVFLLLHYSTHRTKQARGSFYNQRDNP